LFVMVGTYIVCLVLLRSLCSNQFVVQLITFFGTTTVN
jgi:hypothetical protein